MPTYLGMQRSQQRDRQHDMICNPAAKVTGGPTQEADIVQLLHRCSGRYSDVSTQHDPGSMCDCTGAATGSLCDVSRQAACCAVQVAQTPLAKVGTSDRDLTMGTW